jgi:3-deoxy-manno-octulosonate cytidylyltransferase (CMP-KDO synthetase)
MSSAQVVVVIPLRLASTRIPRKVLVDIGGRSLAERTVRRVLDAFRGDERVRVIAAVDAEETLIELSSAFPDLQVLLTDPELPSGTDRVFAAVSRYCESDPRLAGRIRGVVNVQGDMPFVGAAGLKSIVGYVHEAWSAPGEERMATLSEAWPSGRKYDDAAAVKVVMDRSGRAIYFSRHPIPYSKLPFGKDKEFPEAAGDLHIGVYAYTVAALARFCSHAPVALERGESLEQLRAQWLGIPIQVLRTEAEKGESFRGIDTQDDLAWARGFAGGKTPAKKTATRTKKRSTKAAPKKPKRKRK